MSKKAKQRSPVDKNGHADRKYAVGAAGKVALPARGASPLAEIRDFYKFMIEQRLNTLEYDHQGLHVRLVRQAAIQVPVPIPVAAVAAPAHAAAGHTPAPVAAIPSIPSVPAGGISVKSPMMGIFYRANTPSSPPFVKAGDTVKKGHVLCLIEAMKVFNEVKAEYECTVVSVLLENGKPVKAGQDLFIVERK